MSASLHLFFKPGRAPGKRVASWLPVFLYVLFFAFTGLEVRAQQALNANAAAGNIQCIGGSTTVSIQATGGEAPYQYSLNGIQFQSGAVFSNVAAGTYSGLTVTDNNGTAYTLPTLSISAGTQPNATYYRDVDGDGYGNPSLTQLSCTGVPPGFAVNGNDCDDVDALINPGAIEQCNGVDDDCNQLIDDQVAGSVTWYTDNDGDNIGTGTGIVLCYDPGSGYSQIQGDCDDNNDQIHPKSTELCNSIDDDCDGQSDEGLLFENYWYDADGDQYGTGTPLYLCEDPGTDYATNDFDCNDTNSSIHPSAPETCNGIDDNCNGLTDTNDPLLSPAGPLSATASAAPIACKGGTTTVVLTPVGGVAPYSFGTQTLQGVSAGPHTYTVTDANGCTAQTSITLSEPPLLIAGGLHTPVLCHGGISIVNVNASGGVPPYQGIGAVIRNAGTWNLMVTDANGCTAVHTANISQPDPLIATESHTPITCNGGSSIVTIGASGGITPYSGTGIFIQTAGSQSYIVTDANGCATTIQENITEPATLQVSSTAQPIAVYGGTTTVNVSATGGTPPYLGTGNFIRSSGTYTFTVEDANGCSGTTSITLQEPGQLRATATEGTITCFGGSTTVQISANGGVVPYTNTGVFNVSAGPYSFTVIDANGTSVTVSGVISQPNAVEALISASQVICHGDPAIVSVNAAGGVPPYSGTGVYSRVAGTWNFTVSDANGCPASGSISIADALPVVASAHTITPIQCFGQSASVLVTATGGTGVFAGTGLFQRTAGSHRFYVTDSKGCVDSTDMSLAQPPALTASAVHTDILCNGATTGNIDVSANGGTLPYTYQWNGGQIGNNVSNLGAGTYQVTITDNNGCSTGITRVITQPPALISQATAPPILCFGTTTQVNVAANGGVSPYAGTGAFARMAGNYTFTVTDANGCTSQSALNITQPTDLTVMAAEVVPVFCNGQSAEILVDAQGGTGAYNGIGSFQQHAGTGKYIVTDANGCKDSAIVTVTQPDQLAIPALRTNVQCHGGSNGAILAQPFGGAQPYEYSWSNGNLNPGLSGLAAGTYSVTVTDANGCRLDSTFTITQPLPFPSLGGIMGTDTACVAYAHGNTVFSVPGISDGVNSTYYLWDVPNGMTIASGQGTNSITVSWTPQSVDPSITGAINVSASNSCASSGISTGVSMAIIQPVTPGSISGNSRLCYGEIITYSVASVGRATNYVWTLPSGLTLLSGQGTNVISVRVDTTFSGGNVAVTAGNACGISPPRLRATSLNFPSTPGTISGQSTGLCGRTGISYSIAPVNGATSYEWMVPAGVTIVSGQGTTSITVNFNTSAGGAIQVCAVNACGLSACRSMTVSTVPARPGVITAVPPTTPCAGSSTNYSVPTVSGANFYSWTCTGGGSIQSGQGTKAISVLWAPNTVTTTQNIVVRAQNNCGQSTTRSTVVTVNSCLRNAGALATEQLGLTVFPNPSSGPIYVRFISSNEDAFELIIYDVQGRIIARRSGISEYGENIIDIEKSVFPASGMYLLDFEHNGIRGQERFTVE